MSPNIARYVTKDETGTYVKYESGDSRYDLSFGLYGTLKVLPPQGEILLEPATATPGIGYALYAEGVTPDIIPASNLIENHSFFDLTFNNSINLLGGDDSLSLRNSNLTGDTIELGDGNDSIYLTGSSRVQRLSAGKGNDEVFISVLFPDEILETNATIEVANLGDGNDLLRIQAQGILGSDFFETGDGDDKIFIEVGASAKGNVFSLGDGDDYFSISGGTDIRLLDAGSGNDFIEIAVDASAIIDNLILGDGDDRAIYAQNHRHPIELATGRGIDEVKLPSLGIAKGTIDLSEDVQSQDIIRFEGYAGIGNTNTLTVNSFSIENDKIVITPSPDWTFDWEYDGADSQLAAKLNADNNVSSGPLVVVKNADLRERLGSFTIRANGVDFRDWKSIGEIYTASGIITLGDESSGDFFQVEGNAIVDLQNKTVDLTGVVTALTGSAAIKNQVIAGASGLRIDVPQQSASFKGDPTILLGGVVIGLDDLVFRPSDYRLGFNIKALPDKLGIRDELMVKASSGFTVTQNSIELSDASLSLSGSYKLFSTLEAQVQDMSISYDSSADSLLLKGTLVASNLFGSRGPKKVILDLASNDNAIQIKDGSVDLIGFFSVEEIEFATVPWGLDKILLGIDTIDKKLFGELIVRFPFGATIPPGQDVKTDISLGFIYSPSVQLDSIGLEISTEESAYIPIPAFPAAGLTSIGGSVSNIASGDILFTGNVGLVFGPARSINGMFTGELDANQVSGDSKIIIYDERLASYSGKSVLDWTKGLFNATGSLSLLDGLVVTNYDLKANSNFDVYASFSRNVSLPASLTGFDKDIELASGRVDFRFINDNILSNDYITVAGSINVLGVTLEVAYRSYFDGSTYSQLGALQIGNALPVTSSPIEMVASQFSLLRQAQIQAGKQNSDATFSVQPLTEWILLTSSWENQSSVTPDFSINRPDGSLIKSNQLPPSNFALVESLSSQNSLAVLVKAPESGIWSLALTDAISLGEIQYSAFTKNQSPTISIDNILFRENERVVDILYSSADFDSNPSVSLFYSSEEGSNDGLLIAADLKIGANNVYSWDISGLADGNYFFYAVVDDGLNSPVYSYFESPVVIGTGGYLFQGVEPPLPAIRDDGEAVFSIIGEPFVGGRVLGRLDASDPDGDGTFSYQWQSSADGLIWSPIGTNTSSYTIAATDEGKQLRLIVSYKDGEGFQESVESTTQLITAPSLEPLKLDFTTAQVLYVAYYGRPADVGGLSFWQSTIARTGFSYAPRNGDGLTDSEQPLYDRIVVDFGESVESQKLYAGKTAKQSADAVYEYCFGRPAEIDPVTGVNYWVNKLEKQEITLSQLAAEVALGAQGQDLSFIRNKIYSADLFITASDLPAEQAAFAGDADNLIARNWLSQFGPIAATPGQADALVDQLLATTQGI